MPKAFAHRLQSLDPAIELIGLGHQLLPVDLKIHEHGAYLIQRETGSLTQRYQCEPVGHIG